MNSRNRNENIVVLQNFVVLTLQLKVKKKTRQSGFQIDVNFLHANTFWLKILFKYD